MQIKEPRGLSDEERAAMYAAKCQPAGAGCRNTALNGFGYALLERFNLDYEYYEQLCLEYNARCDPPLDAREAEQTTLSAWKGCKRKGMCLSKRSDEEAYVGGSARPAKPVPVAGQQGDPSSKVAQPPQFASQALAEHLESVIAGKHYAVEMPWPGVSKLTQALLPGTMTVLCAPPGASKSLMMLDLTIKLVESGEPVAVMAMEESQTFHCQRVLAQIAGNSAFMDLEWVRRNPDKVRNTMAEHAPMVDEIGRCMYSPPLEMTGANIAAWVKEMIDAGKRVIVVDPISAKQSSGKQVWQDDQETLQAMRVALKDKNCSIVLVTHPNGETDSRKLLADPLADFSGGKCWSRFTQTCLFLRPLPEPKEMNIRNRMGILKHEVNRVMEIRKTRNGKGSGAWIGMWFDHATLRTRELGVIQK